MKAFIKICVICLCLAPVSQASAGILSEVAEVISEVVTKYVIREYADEPFEYVVKGQSDELLGVFYRGPSDELLEHLSREQGGELLEHLSREQGGELLEHLSRGPSDEIFGYLSREQGDELLGYLSRKQGDKIFEVDSLLKDEHLKFTLLPGLPLEIEKKLPSSQFDVLLKMNPYQPVSQPRLLAAIPTNDLEFKRVYGPVTQKFRDEMKNIGEILENLKGKNVTTNCKGFEALKKEIHASEGNLLVITAHSKNNGRMLVMPNGEELPIEHLYNESKAAKKICFVLTCYGDDFSISGKIATKDALDMWDHAFTEWQKIEEMKSPRGPLSDVVQRTLLTEISKVNIDDFIGFMRTKRQVLEIETKKRIFIGGIVAVPVSTGAVLLLVESRQE